MQVKLISNNFTTKQLNEHSTVFEPEPFCKEIHVGPLKESQTWFCRIVITCSQIFNASYLSNHTLCAHIITHSLEQPINRLMVRIDNLHLEPIFIEHEAEMIMPKTNTAQRPPTNRARMRKRRPLFILHATVYVSIKCARASTSIII